VLAVVESPTTILAADRGVSPQRVNPSAIRLLVAEVLRLDLVD